VPMNAIQAALGHKSPARGVCSVAPTSSSTCSVPLGSRSRRRPDWPGPGRGHPAGGANRGSAPAVGIGQARAPDGLGPAVSGCDLMIAGLGRLSGVQALNSTSDALRPGPRRRDGARLHRGRDPSRPPTGRKASGTGRRQEWDGRIRC
jgi:hypothetical protein